MTSKKKTDRVLNGPFGFPAYQTKKGEEYMNEKQEDHFRAILGAWKTELMEEVDRTVHHMQDEAANFPDPNDRATQESEFSLELRTRDRERKLIKKIDDTISLIDQGGPFPYSKDGSTFQNREELLPDKDRKSVV